MPGAWQIRLMDASNWDERYAGAELVWTDNPNIFIEEILAEAAAGRAVDLAAGEGRHTVWLAKRGWHVTAVDFSGVGLQRARQWAEAEGVGDLVTTVTADVADFTPTPDSLDLLLLAYVQVPQQVRQQALRQAAGGVKIGGQVVVVAHDSSNLTEGAGGPPDPQVLYTAEDVVADLQSMDAQWLIHRAEVALREVAGAPRPARDAVVVAERTA